MPLSGRMFRYLLTRWSGSEAMSRFSRSLTKPLGDRQALRKCFLDCLESLVPSEEAEVDGASPLRFRAAVLVPVDRLHQCASKRDRRVAARYDQKLLFFSESPWMCCRGHLFCPDLGNEASPRVVPLSSRAFFAGEGLSCRAHSAGNR